MRGLMFTYNVPIPEASEFMEGLTKTYQKRLKHTFNMKVYSEVHDPDVDFDYVTLKVVLDLKDPGRKDDMPAKAQVGIGLLSKKASKKELIQVDNMPDVDWTNEDSDAEGGESGGQPAA